jgi:REP element-mobilizing transposase RayT
MRQSYFPGFHRLSDKEFGGIHIKGNARSQRPVAAKRPMHLVMRSTLAVGSRSFLRKRRQLEELVRKTGKAKGVKIYRMANAGNHLHLIVLPKTRASYRAFIRAISGLIARSTLGAQRGRALGQKFWDALPFTRILEWGRDYRNTCDYLLQNTLEALGFIPYKPRKSKPPPKR